MTALYQLMQTYLQSCCTRMAPQFSVWADTFLNWATRKAIANFGDLASRKLNTAITCWSVRDSLIPLDKRSFKGAYYTPLHVVDKAYDKLSESLGPNWQKDYIVWDMCCGVGGLEVKHGNPRNIYMSTLDRLT